MTANHIFQVHMFLTSKLNLADSHRSQYKATLTVVKISTLGEGTDVSFVGAHAVAQNQYE
jgi:hypothetical protein